MPYELEHILLHDEWTEADRTVLRQAFEADPALEAALRRWEELRAGAASRWESDVPSRAALVLLACQDRLDPAAMSENERSLLQEASARVDQAIRRHPAVEDVLGRIRTEADAFDREWARAFDRSGIASPAKTARGPLRKAVGSPSRGLRLARLSLAAAATIALLFVGRIWLNPAVPAPVMSFSAQTGMQVVSLEDGSRVRLAPQASLDVYFDESSTERRVRLHGDGFFEITSQARPFRVETDNALTTVLGTTFGVRTQEGTEVLLVSGRVSMAPTNEAGQGITLSPGQRGLLAPGDATPRVQEFTMPEGFEWSGLLIFRSTPMQTVVERLSDAFDLSISVSDDLKETPLTGTFESERGSTTILSIIASALGATVTERANGSLHVHR